jgi:hypothetical protein
MLVNPHIFKLYGKLRHYYDTKANVQYGTYPVGFYGFIVYNFIPLKFLCFRCIKKM